MGLFNRGKAKVAEVTRAVQKKFGGYYSQTIHIPPSMSTADYLRSYGQIGWLFACVSKISQNVGSSEWKAYRGEDTVESLALKLLEHPNPYMSKYDLLLRTSGYLDLTGRAFWYLARDGVGRPKEIWLINPLDMWVVPDKENFIKGYVYRAGVDHIPLEADEVIFFNLPDFINPYSGVGPAQASGTALESDKYSAQWNRNFFYNNAEPQGILTLPDVGDDDFDRLKEDWNDRHRGVDNAKKTAFVRGEGVKYTPIQINQKDMDFFNLRNQSRDEILGAFGVHKSVLGLTDSVSRANAETAEYVFQAHVIKPRLHMIQDKLNNEYVIMFKEDIELKYTDPVPENKDFIKAVLDTQVNKTLTVNEGREILNKMLGLKLEPVESGDVIYVTGAPTPLGTEVESTQPNLAPSESEESGGINTQDEGSEKNPDGKFLVSGRLDRGARKKISRLIIKGNKDRAERFHKMSEPLTEEFSKILEKYLDSQLEEVAQKAVEGDKDPLSNVKDWNSKLKKLTKPLYEKTTLAGGKAVVNEFKSIGNYIHKDVGIIFDFKDAMVQRMIQEKVNKIIGINEVTRQWVRDTLLEAYNSEGEDRTFAIADITKMMGSVFSKERAKTISLTETLSTLNLATSLTYKQNSDLIDGKYWLHSGIGKPRETHIEASRKYDESGAIPVDEQFEVGGYDCDCPGDSSLPAEEVVNCHCCMSPKVNVD